MAKARVAPLPPFPRAAVILTEQIVRKLKEVETDLDEVLVALGMAGLPR